jgi:uncharacterized repeat protein (TIGR01451 family)
MRKLAFAAVAGIALLSAACSQHSEMGPAEHGSAKAATARNRTPLSDLPLAAQGQISGVLGRDDRRYHAVARDQGFRMANPPHQLAADFDSAGASVRIGTATWGLRLNSFGYGGDLRVVDPITPVAVGNRVEYQRELLNEWYVNGPSGVEQGFTIDRAPARRTGEPLTLAFHTSGNLTTAIDSSGTAAVLSRADGTPALRYRGLTAYDATGRALDAWLDVNAQTLQLRVDDTDAQYPLIVDPFIEHAGLIASDGSAGDQFGAVAVDGDTIVVGAWMDDVGANADQGSAYVFVKPAGGWSGLLNEQARLIASDGAAGDGFGLDVAVDGDTVVVGARNDDISGRTNQGSVYVFAKPADGWSGTLTQAAKLTASGGTTNDIFGDALAVDGDTIVVGARGDDIGGCFNCTVTGDRGSAYVFVRPAAGWSGNLTQNAILGPSQFTGDGYQFGSSVAISGHTIVVGAWDPRNCIGCGGDAFVFVKPVTGWSGSLSQNARLRASDPTFGDHFGISVAISADTIVVGSYQDDTGTKTNHGSAYVFVKSADGWTGTRNQDAKLTASDGSAQDEFGFSVAVSGNTIVVAARFDDVGANVDQGSVYVFTEPASGWSGSGALNENDKLTVSGGAAGDQFGNWLAASGGAVVVGAPFHDSGPNADQGSAYVFVTDDADLSITKGGSPTSVIAGDDLTYTLTIRNDGPSDASSITVTDNLPAAVSFVSCEATGGGSCGGSGNNRIATFASLAAGTSATITIAARVNAGTPEGTITNTAWVASASDPISANDTSTTTTLVGNADGTPPIIESLVTPAPNAAGWHNSTPTVTWSVADPESGIATSSGCDTTTIAADTTELVLTCSATDGAGLSASASVSIRLDTIAPTITAARSPAANASGWNNTDVNVSFECDDQHSGVSSCTPPQIVTGEGSGQSVTATAQDAAGNETTAVISDINIDRTPPVVTATTTAPNAAGWNNTDVMVDFACTDVLSGVSSEPADASLTAEGANQSASASCQDAAGNPASLTVHNINIDKTAPIVSGTPSRSADTNGWYNHALDVSWSSVDALSGSGLCSVPTSYGGPDTAAGSVAGECVDRADNTGRATFAFLFDATPPTIAIAHPADGAALLLGQAAAASYTCVDATSGVGACAGPVASGAPLDTSAVGVRTFTVTAMDLAGNTAALIHQYSVASKFKFEGFFAPLNNLPMTNRGPAGRTFPVKFALYDASGAFIGDPDAITAVGIVSAACGTLAGDVDGEETSVDAGGLKYDALSGVWHFNWQTTRSQVGCWLLEVHLADRSVHRVAFELR